MPDFEVCLKLFVIFLQLFVMALFAGDVSIPKKGPKSIDVFGMNFMLLTTYIMPMFQANLALLVVMVCFIYLDLSLFYWIIDYRVPMKSNEEDEHSFFLPKRMLIVGTYGYILLQVCLFTFGYYEDKLPLFGLFIVLCFIKLAFFFYYEDPELESERDFKNYEKLPAGLRKMVIDQMEPKARCTFSGCSKLTNKEAKQSNDYIHGLKISTYNDYSTITVTHLSTGFNAEGYVLNFSEDGDKKYVQCAKMERSERRYSATEKLWNTKLDISRNADEHAVQYFKRLLGMYQNKIKKLSINMTTDSTNKVDFEVNNLDNLEELEIHSGADVQQFLAKTRKQLKVLTVGGKDLANLENFEQIYHSQQLSSHGTKLNNAQFSRLAASDVSINIGSLTENDIYNFIRSWQDGTIGKEIKRFSWDLTDSTFNVGTVLQLLGVEMNGNPRERYEIEHHKKAATRAVLRCYQWTLGSWMFSFEPINKAQK